MSDAVPPIEPELWCLGCRRVGVRRLTPGQRAWLAGLRARHLRRALLGLGLVPAAAALVWAVAATAGPAHVGWAEVPVDIGLVLTIWVGVPAAILTVRDHGGAWRRLGRDLASGDAWWFEPPVDAAEAGDGAPRPAFGVLPHSRRFLDLADRRLHLMRADVIETAPQSASGWYAPLALEVSGPGPPPDFRQRTLNGPEREELARVASALSWPRLDTALALAGALVLIGLFVARQRAGALPRATELISGGVWGFVCVRVILRHVRAVRLAWRLRRDLSVGLVVHAPASAGPGGEFLPFSRLMWKDGGAPAGWRDRQDAVRRLRRGL